jgi:hypothetical protein
MQAVKDNKTNLTAVVAYGEGLEVQAQLDKGHHWLQ